jgi:hypothetical protein
LVERLDVALPKSSRSNNSTSNPRVVASTAIPMPVAPPPMMTMSHGAVRASTRASISSRFMPVLLWLQNA